MIYLLHSTVPVGGTGKHSACHYLGYTQDANWRKRIDDHRAGRTHVAIINAFLAVGGKLLLTAVLPGGTKADERRIKEMGHMARFCPLCKGKQNIGWPNGMVALIPTRPWLRRLSEKPPKETGGDLPHRNSTLQTILDGPSPAELYPVSTTSYGVRGVDWATGGTSSTATAHKGDGNTGTSAGTRQPSLSETSASGEENES